MGALPIDLDWEKMISLLQRFQERRLSIEEGIELKPLLEKYYEQAVLKKDKSLEAKLNIMLIGLNGYISGEISESEYRQ
jgi:uncharacterized protein YktA (UPF0223 family)